MLVIDICKDVILLAAVALASIVAAHSIWAWNNLPEYVWHVTR